MTTERAKTVKGLLEEHRRRRRAAVGSSTRKRPPLRSQIQPANPVSQWFRDKGIDMSDVRRK
jgi:hypothetical protein